MNTQLDLMRKRIEHTRNKQKEDYEKELALRLAKKGIRYDAASRKLKRGDKNGKNIKHKNIELSR